MRKHSQRLKRRQQSAACGKCTSNKCPAASPEVFGFVAAFLKLFAVTGLPVLPKRRGRHARVSLGNLLSALVFHLMHTTGTLGEHFAMLHEDALCDSACSDRRTRLPWQVFADLMRRALRPLASLRRHPDAFWRGWRLVALDGTQFSLTNTPQLKGAIKKGVIKKNKSRRGQAAFAKMGVGVLLELGLHNPLAAVIGHRGQTEWEMARSLLAQLPKASLLLADRLHGCAAFAAQALVACRRVGGHFLIRARKDIQARTVKRFKDGSRLIRVPVRKKNSSKVILQWLELREIRVRVQRRGFQTQDLRLWTSLLDAKTAPAGELAELYARRWEHELYYRELKRQLRKGPVLQSHTVMTGAQEIAAMIVASAMLAGERARAAAGQVAVLRVSFLKTLALMRPLWVVLALGDDLLSEDQKRQLTERFQEQLRLCQSRPRRVRSCPRAVRQTLSKWPRLRENKSSNEPLRLTVV